MKFPLSSTYFHARELITNDGDCRDGSRLKSTPLGIALLHDRSIDSELVLPHLRRAIEERLNHIASGRQTSTRFFNSSWPYSPQSIAATSLNTSRRWISSSSKFPSPASPIADAHSQGVENVDDTFNTGNLALSVSPSLYCPFCADMDDTKCSLDDFELVLWTQGDKGKSMVFCPYCYANPPFFGVKGVDACTECPSGTFVLDDAHAPKFRLCECNFSRYLVGAEEMCSRGESQLQCLLFPPCTTLSMQAVAGGCTSRVRRGSRGFGGSAGSAGEVGLGSPY
ncbi:hypothetical protein Aperf_G00000063845 [Anoplocephala perfoliata]